MKKKRVVLYFDPIQWESMQHLKQATGVSISELIRRSAAVVIENYQKMGVLPEVSNTDPTIVS